MSLHHRVAGAQTLLLLGKGDVAVKRRSHVTGRVSHHDHHPGWAECPGCVQHVLDHIRQVAPRKETLNMLSVVDQAGRLVDQLRLEDLVLAEPGATVSDTIDRHPVFLVPDEDRERAVEVFKKYDEVALPVVDAAGALVGIVTPADVMDVQEEEDTEDFHKMAGVAALQEPYFATTFIEMLRKRLPWLGLGAPRDRETWVTAAKTGSESRPPRHHGPWKMAGQEVRILAVVQNGDLKERYHHSSPTKPGDWFHKGAEHYPRYVLRAE